jgi:hypothetical protein
VSEKPFSILVWVYPTISPADSQSFISIGTTDYNSISFALNDDETLIFVGDTDGASGWEIIDFSTGAITLNEWSNIGLIRDTSGVYTYYINGADAGGGFTNANDLFINTNILKIGGHYRGTSGYDFNGSIDEVMIFNRSLSATEIKQLYIKGKAKWNYTTSQNLTSGGNNTYNISTLTTNILPEYKFFSGNGTETSDSETPFYSPLLFSGMSFDFYGGPSPDSEYPIFFSPTETPADSPTYSAGQSYEFNISINNTNGTAWIRFNGTNYSASNYTGIIFNWTTLDLSAGTFHYNWSAYGNGSSNNFNMSNSYTYTINQASSVVNLTLNNSQQNISIVNNTAIDLNCSTITGDSSAYLELWNNGTLINNGTSPIGNTTLFNTNLGDYNITCIYEATQNYSRISQIYYVNVTGVADAVNPEISIVYPANNTNSTNTGLNVNYTFSDETGVDSCWYSNDSYSVNTTLASCVNITTITWSEGQHNVSVWVNDTSGNENMSSVSFTIDSTAPNVTINYPTSGLELNYVSSINFNVTALDETEVSSCWYTLNSVLIILLC